MNEIEKALNFNNSHNISTKQPMGVMAVSEAMKLIKEAKKEERERIKKLIGKWYFDDDDDAKDYSGWNLNELHQRIAKNE